MVAALLKPPLKVGPSPLAGPKLACQLAALLAGIPGAQLGCLPHFKPICARIVPGAANTPTVLFSPRRGSLACHCFGSATPI